MIAYPKSVKEMTDTFDSLKQTNKQKTQNTAGKLSRKSKASYILGEDICQAHHREKANILHI